MSIVLLGLDSEDRTVNATQLIRTHIKCRILTASACNMARMCSDAGN
jgi:hypothetical protein